MRSKKLTLVLTAFVLVLAFLLTGFGTPGFLLGMLELHPVEERTLSEEQTAVPELITVTGDSKPYSLDPSAGFHVEAPENTFKKGTKLKVEELNEKKVMDLEEEYWEKIQRTGFVYGAWEMDAGMEPDEKSPGLYTMTWNLEEMGIPKEKWDTISVVRKDALGGYTEYVRKREGGPVLSVQSRQNSIWMVIGLVTLGTAGLEALNYSKSEWWAAEEYYVRIDGEDRYCIQFTEGTTLDHLKKQLMKAESRVRKEVNRQYNFGHDTEKVQTGYVNCLLAENKPVENMDAVSFKAMYAAVMQHAFRRDPEYAEIEQSIREYGESPEGERDFLMLRELSARVQLAHQFLKSRGGADFDMPTSTVTLKLYGEASAATSTPYIPFRNPFVYIPTAMFSSDASSDTMSAVYDSLTCTLAHELFHVCQREYKWASFQSLKYDEATAQLVELDARDYFLKNGMIHSRPAVTEQNLNLLQAYALPLDSYEVTYPQEGRYGGSFSCTSNLKELYQYYIKPPEDTEKSMSRSSSGYPYAHFLLYLRDHYRKERTISYHDLLSAYGSDFGFFTPWSEIGDRLSNIGTASIAPLIRLAFGLSEESMDLAWELFAREKMAMFYNWAKDPGLQYGKCNWAIPRIEVTPEKPAVIPLVDHDYTIRMRQIQPKLPDGYKGQVALMLTNDAKFQTELGDTRIIPAGKFAITKPVPQAEERNYTATRFGLVTKCTDIPADGYWVMEVDGGTGNGGSASYEATLLTEPQLTDVKVEKGQLSFRLPQKSAAGKAGRIDGYHLEIFAQGQLIEVGNFRIEHAEDLVSIETDILKDHLETDEDKKGLYPEYTLKIQEIIMTGEADYVGGPVSEVRVGDQPSGLEGNYVLTAEANAAGDEVFSTKVDAPEMKVSIYDGNLVSLDTTLTYHNMLFLAKFGEDNFEGFGGADFFGMTEENGVHIDTECAATVHAYVDGKVHVQAENMELILDLMKGHSTEAVIPVTTEVNIRYEAKIYDPEYISMQDIQDILKRSNMKDGTETHENEYIMRLSVKKVDGEMRMECELLSNLVNSIHSTTPPLRFTGTRIN